MPYLHDHIIIAFGHPAELNHFLTRIRWEEDVHGFGLSDEVEWHPSHESMSHLVLTYTEEAALGQGFDTFSRVLARYHNLGFLRVLVDADSFDGMLATRREHHDHVMSNPIDCSSHHLLAPFAGLPARFELLLDDDRAIDEHAGWAKACALAKHFVEGQLASNAKQISLAPEAVMAEV